MQTLTLGRTGLRVSRLGLGLAALGRPGYITLGHASDLEHDYDVAQMATRTAAVCHAAWTAGIRYFDTARSYGQGEAFLAHWLGAQHIPADDGVTVGSKWGYTYTAQWHVRANQHEIKEHSLATLARQAAESQHILGRYLRLYQIHSATLETGVLENEPVLTELGRLRDTGLKIGLTVTGPRQADTVKRALGVMSAGRPLFDCVQATWNLLEPSVGQALAEAHAAGLGVIIKEGLANGRLTVRNDDPAFAAKRHVLDEASQQVRSTPDAVALAAVLAQPWADVVLCGAATVDQLRSNIRALDVDFARVRERLDMLREDPDDYWNRRAAMPWN